MHQLFMGILLGLGAAIPIGPVNLEIIRRNLQFGSLFGFCFGLGACLADLSYLILLSLGALTLLTHVMVLNVVGILGSIILAYFGVCALRMRVNDDSTMLATPLEKRDWWLQTVSGFLMTVLNPYTILFWSSVSSQVAIVAKQRASATLFAGAGVLVGTILWVISLNLILHLTKHRLSSKVSVWLNRIGGIILLAFAILGILKVFL